MNVKFTRFRGRLATWVSNRIGDYAAKRHEAPQPRDVGRLCQRTHVPSADRAPQQCHQHWTGHRRIMHASARITVTVLFHVVTLQLDDDHLDRRGRVIHIGMRLTGRIGIQPVCLPTLPVVSVHNLAVLIDDLELTIR